MVGSENHDAGANLHPSSSNDIVPILYVGPSSLGLTNLLMTHPTTPVRTPPLSFRIPLSRPFPLLLEGSWIRPRDARG
jgi:hypothetical protein